MSEQIATERPLIELEKKQKTMLTIACLLCLTLILFFNSMTNNVGSYITSALGNASLFGFRSTIFFLCSTAMMPIAVKVGDKFGRKPIICIGVVIYGTSLLIGGITNSMTVHLIARAFQGLGQGCLLANSLAFLGEINIAKDRIRALGWYAVITGITNIVGPLLAGVLADFASWRYTCWTAFPIAIVVLLLCLKYMPKVPIEKNTKIDFAGAISIAVAAAGIVFYISFGGRYGYTSTFGIAMLALFVLGLIAMFIFERKAESPCLDLSLFKHKKFTLTVLAVVCLAPAMYATGSYVANYGMAVKGLSATYSSTFTALNNAAVLAMGALYTAISGKMRIKNWLILDALIYTANVVCMIFLGVETALAFIYVTVILQGCRTAIYMPAFTTSLQNDMPKDKTGIATSSVQFLQGLAGTLGVSIVSMVLNNTFNASLGNVVPEGLLKFAEQADLSKFQTSTYLMSAKAAEVAEYKAALPADAAPLFDQMMTNVRTAYAGGLSAAYKILLVLMIIGFVSTVILRIVDRPDQQITD